MTEGVISINAKCSDLFSATLTDKGGHFKGEYDGYVPKFFPGQHFGDYVELRIDIATGRILNWKRPTQKQLDDTFKKD